MLCLAEMQPSGQSGTAPKSRWRRRRSAGTQPIGHEGTRGGGGGGDGDGGEGLGGGGEGDGGGGDGDPDGSGGRTGGGVGFRRARRTAAGRVSVLSTTPMVLVVVMVADVNLAPSE